MTRAPVVKGWCPGAYRPMMAEDGFVVRIRPRMGRVSAAEAAGLCTASLEYGSGCIDLTNRANLQIRGISESDHEAVLARLGELDLLDKDPAMESRRNLLVAPFWTQGDTVSTLSERLLAHLGDLPALPAKVGFALDCSDAGPLLTQDPADIRIEKGEAGLILRADGCTKGRAVTQETAIPALIEMAHWLADHITPQARRMAAVVAQEHLPDQWATEKMRAPARRPTVGMVPLGALVGLPFGQIDAKALLESLSDGVQSLRLTPWRALVLEGGAMSGDASFITDPHDPLLRVDACVGAPLCASATSETRALARQLAPLMRGSLHVSGCAKGCARARPADVVLIAQEGTFSLVKDGCANDTPVRTGLSPTDLLTGEF
ncbi:cobalamin biosynthesis protein CobG [Lentibacter sp. XHP0401]|uniref:cobalamin biosynthesis protein CobG n=1 Tax=Lentibacter sp. XHP0401 TaxID=2984334 RepID=UPI0021E9A4D5|nr:cobalamin biosynthesis protein CobG [Lentibacter sp. XHP0401]MCV2892043.1 cobalamin biosynthesis protein CobG [Lentibacter sp. XHP0401]